MMKLSKVWNEDIPGGISNEGLGGISNGDETDIITKEEKERLATPFGIK